MGDANHHGKDEMNLVVLRKSGRLADDGHGKSQGKANIATKADDPLLGKPGLAAGMATTGKRVLSQPAVQAQKQAPT